MIDREKVIKGLECCLDEDARGDNCWENGDYPACPYNGNVDGCMGRLERDALELLKALEPVRALISIEQSDGWKEGSCPKCGMKLDSFYNAYYCGTCGSAVKWE